MRLCEGCNSPLTNGNIRYVLETPDGCGATLRDSRTKKSYGTVFPKDLIKAIVSGDAAVCQPCARAAIDLFTGSNAPSESIGADTHLYASHVMCEHCNHSAGADHQRGECFARNGLRRCECRTLRVS